MAESGGIIRVMGTDGVVKEVTLYTDVSDVTEFYKEFKYNGQVVYASTTTDPDDEYATGFRYVDTDGVTRYLCETTPVIINRNGTVVINGDLSADLTVDCNLNVTGTISGSVKAAGTVTYGSLTGTVTEKAVLESCDIRVENGTVSFAESVTESDGALYTADSVTNSSDADAVLYHNLTVYTDSQNALYNQGNLTVAEGCTVNTTSTYGSSGHGIYNVGSSSARASISVRGILYAQGTGSGGYGVNNNSYADFTIESVGSVTATGGNTGMYSRGSGSGINNLCFYGTLIAEGTGSNSYGLYSNTANLTIGSTGSVTATGGYCGVSNRDAPVFTIENGGSLTATGGSYGFYNYSSDGNSHNVNIFGTLIAEGTDSGSYGVYDNAYANFTIESGGSVTATGERYGFYSSGSSDSERSYIGVYGTLTVEGTGSDGYGIYDQRYTDFIVYSDGVVNATGTVYAIYNTESSCTFTVESGGELNVNGDTYGI